MTKKKTRKKRPAVAPLTGLTEKERKALLAWGKKRRKMTADGKKK